MPHIGRIGLRKPVLFCKWLHETARMCMKKKERKPLITPAKPGTSSPWRGGRVVEGAPLLRAKHPHKNQQVTDAVCRSMHMEPSSAWDLWPIDHGLPLPDPSAEFSDDVANWLRRLLTTSSPSFGTRGDAGGFMKLATLYHAGECVFAPFHMDALLLEWQSYKNDTRETAYHQAGKDIAERWIDTQGGRPVKEYPYDGGRIDVGCSALRIGVEVGDVAPQRLLSMMIYGDFRQVILVPVSNQLRRMLSHNAPISIPAIRMWLTEAGHARVRDWEEAEMEAMRRVANTLELPDALPASPLSLGEAK